MKLWTGILFNFLFGIFVGTLCPSIPKPPYPCTPSHSGQITHSPCQVAKRLVVPAAFNVFACLFVYVSAIHMSPEINKNNSIAKNKKKKQTKGRAF